MDLLRGSVWPKVALLFLIAIHLRTDAMQITSTGPQTIQKAEGETVNLGCTYTPGADDKGELDVEWSSVSPDMTQKDKLILSYAASETHHYDPDLSKRMTFVTTPDVGDASISISALKGSDTGTYQCKVKKAPGVDMRKVTLVVQVPPSEPKCWVEGGEEKGTTVSLRCKSTKGSIPLTYAWKRETGGAMPATATQDAQSGELLIKNHTDSNTGIYVCEAKNGVGQAQCKYTLNAYNPTDKVGVIVGAVIGALLLFILLLLLIWLLICCCQKKRYQKEAENEIREDAPAPESRPSSRLTNRQSSRHSSVPSMAGYRTHHGVQYTSVKAPMSSIRETSPIYSSDRNAPSPAGDGRASLQYDPQYGYAV